MSPFPQSVADPSEFSTLLLAPVVIQVAIVPKNFKWPCWIRG